MKMQNAVSYYSRVGTPSSNVKTVMQTKPENLLSKNGNFNFKTIPQYIYKIGTSSYIMAVSDGQ